MPSTQLNSLKRKFITFGKPDISEEEIAAVADVLRSGWVGTGKVSRKLEEEFEKYMGGGYAISVSSCTIGLVIALRALGVCRNQNVLTTPLTFCATVNAILQAGATPMFSEVDSRGCLDPEKMNLQGIHLKIGAILPVHYTGSNCEMNYLSQEAGRYEIPVLEDAAHSFGGTYFGGRKQGSMGSASVFSLYATKNITSVEGGIIWTRDVDVAKRCRVLSQNGQSSGAWSRYSSGPIENYQVSHPGFKGNLPDVLAAVGLAQIKRWPELKKKRDKIFTIYEEAFGAREFGHSQHLFTILVKNRAELRERLFNKGIGTGIHYGALHLEPAYKYLGYKKGDFPMAEKIGSKTLSLPVSNTMTPEDAEYVVKTVKQEMR